MGHTGLKIKINHEPEESQSTQFEYLIKKLKN